MAATLGCTSAATRETGSEADPRHVFARLKDARPSVWLWGLGAPIRL
jgi:hypothetical protein